MSNGKLQAYLRHGHQLVKGWLFPGARRAIVLLSQAQRDIAVSGGVAEIGVHHGKLFILLYLLGSEDEPAVAIDLFGLQQLNRDHSGAGDLERFKSNLRRHADLSRLVIHEGDSTLLTAGRLLELGRGPLRLISIDGGHTAEITAHDLATSEGALAEGGIIILDDCFNEMWPGVADGVHRYFAEPRSIVPFGMGANKTFFCHRAFAGQYAEVLKKVDRRAAENEFLAERVVSFSFAPWTVAGWMRRVDAFRIFRRIYHDVLSRARV
jgi:hypothetical protein